MQKDSMGVLPPTFKAAILVAILFLTGWTAAQAQNSISIGWDPVADNSVVGYVIYSGNLSGHYSSRIDVGTNIMFSAANLIPGLTYYYTVTAYNFAGVESPPTGEISYTAPLVVPLRPNLNPLGGYLWMQFPIYVGHWYEVQLSTDLQNWNTVWTTPMTVQNTTFTFADFNWRQYSSIFYRLLEH